MRDKSPESATFDRRRDRYTVPRLTHCHRGTSRRLVDRSGFFSNMHAPDCARSRAAKSIAWILHGIRSASASLRQSTPARVLRPRDDVRSTNANVDRCSRSADDRSPPKPICPLLRPARRERTAPALAPWMARAGPRRSGGRGETSWHSATWVVCEWRERAKSYGANKKASCRVCLDSSGPYRHAQFAHRQRTVRPNRPSLRPCLQVLAGLAIL